MLLHPSFPRWRWVLTGVSLLLLILGLWMLLKSRAEPLSPVPAAVRDAANAPGITMVDPEPAVAQKVSKPKHKLAGPVTRKGFWELAEGETGLLSYVSEKTKTNGMMLVKLSTDEKGWIILENKQFHLKDESLRVNGLEAYMPELMQFEKFEKLSAAEARELIKILETTEGVSYNGHGKSHNKANVPRGVSGSSINADKQMVIKETQRFLPGAPDEAGLHRVEVEFTTEFGPGSLDREF